ncbi:hypothetical protein LTR56_002993 [Elasticomyces elasticus]|nr:hypothetical protein LTR56_002993 [Elasticomyces elasticus]KAK3662056.1 hypothetical protein LTR22_007028 [Elasticomyces elasticus]KAK4927582.1 hypothetical protein LTR49_005723 [Elasticomyces elasticus]KAK5753205.1 hypothetical protein LTS12_016672 [Elasticomyces elasticus]
MEDPSTRRQLPPGYIETLEARIAMLEGLLRDSRPEMALDHIRPDDSNPSLGEFEAAPEVESDVTRMYFDTPTAPATASKADVPVMLERLCMSSVVGSPAYFGLSSPLTFSRVLGTTFKALRFHGPGLTMSGIDIDNTVLGPIPRPSPAPLPARFFGELLEGAYFDHIHPQYPFLHRPTFRSWQDKVFAATDRGEVPQPLHLFFVYMVYAVGALVSTSSSPTSAEAYYAAAEELLEQVMSIAGLTCVQAMLCCAMYSMRSMSGASLWTLSGLALRQCIELGYHRDLDWPNHQTDILTVEMQRRVFWVSYTIDRSAAFSLGRPFGITDMDINAKFPLDLDDEHISAAGLTSHPRQADSQPPTLVSAAIHGVRMRRIWGDIRQAVYYDERRGASGGGTAIEEVRSKLHCWLSRRPTVQSQHGNRNVAFGSDKWFFLSYHHAKLLLHRPSITGASRADGLDKSSLAKVQLECAESSAIICTIYRDFYMQSTALYPGWGALHVLFVAGLTFLHCLCVSSEVRRMYGKDRVSSVTTACTIVLVIMTERWAAAQPYRDMFNMLSEKTQAMLAQQDDRREPRLPLVSMEQASAGVRSIAGLGMDDSVRHLLADMVQ